MPTPTLQWQLSTDGGTTFANINGATGGSYTTPATTTADSGKRYRVIATNSAGSRTSTTVGLGVLASAPVTPFLGRWPTPSMVEAVNNSVGGLIREVQLACGRDGSCLGVWARISSNDPANDGVYAARYTTAAGWGAVSPVALDRGREPKVGVDDLGNAVVAWSANDATNTRQAFVRRFSPTTGWSSVAQLSPAGTDRTTTPMALAMNGSGQVTVAYARRLAADAADSLWAARPDGGGWTSVRVPDAGTTINDLSARVDGLGRPTLLWRGTGDAVLAASGAADGAWPNAVNLSGTRNSGATPRLALDADGQAIAVWLDDVAGGDTTLNLRRRPGGGAWQAAQIQTFAAAEGVNCVDLAAGPAGVATVVYAIGAGNIATRDFTAAGGWSPTHSLLVDGAVIDSDLPRIVMDGSGNVTVLWRGIDTAGNGAVYTRSYTAGLGWAPLLTASPIPLATYDQSYRETALAPLGDGRAAMLFLRTNTSFLDELLGAVQTR